MGQIDFVISMVLIGLFTIAIIGFAVNFANDNNAAIDISNDPELVSLRSNTESRILTQGVQSESTYSSILNSSITKGDTLESGGVFSLTISNSIPFVKNILDVGYKKIFGGGDFGIFLTAFLAVIGFLGAMYFVKTWLGRNPD